MQENVQEGGCATTHRDSLQTASENSALRAHLRLAVNGMAMCESQESTSKPDRGYFGLQVK